VQDRIKAATLSIQQVPSEQQVNAGIDPRCLVRFSGDDKVAIEVFKLNVERIVSDADHFVEELHVTTVQEAVTFFKLDNEELAEPSGD
jgi:hypothetical protein